MNTTIASLLTSYGYALLFLLVGLESLGIPLPGETALVTAAALAALGHLSIWGVIATSAVAAILGDNGGYWIGRKSGLPLVRRYGRFIRLKESHLDTARGFFERHGAKTVFIGRFIALLRTWSAVLAGTAHMPYGRFMAYNMLGGVCWSVIFGTLGFVFGRNLPQLHRYLGRASVVAVLLVALTATLSLWWPWFERHRRSLSDPVDHLRERALAVPAVERFGGHFPRFWKFVTARFARGEYLGLHLAIGFAISVAGLWLFGLITEDVINHEGLAEFDLALLGWFRAHTTATGHRVFQAVSLAGSPLVMTVLAAGVTLLLAVRRRWILISGWLAAIAGGGLLIEVLKTVVKRARPAYIVPAFAGQSWSFPSGHAMGSLIGYGMLAYLIVVLWAERRQVQVAVVTAATLLVLAIGASRLYLGVHYFSDVVGGYAAGVLWLATCMSGLEIVRRRPPGPPPPGS